MKKSISINIQGILFNIEEDGYEKLQKYLESLKIHFKNIEDKDEIINDIEYRIVEIFQSKLNSKNEVISLENIDEIISILGEVSDIEIDEEINEYTNSNEKNTHTSNEKKINQKQFYRDSKNKILGGVSSGIANYFGIDPIFVRLIFIVLIFGIHINPIFFFTGISISFSSFSIISYLVLWMILPASDSLESKNKVFRDTEESLIGGVSSGIGKYLGTQTLYIRLAFIILAFFGGSGLFIYFILWVIIPEAKTVAEKVQMQGEPLTIDNIEKKLKNSLNIDEKQKDQKLIFKILFIPIKVLGEIIKAFAPVLKSIFLFIINFIRFSVGFGIVSLSIFISFVLFVTIGVFFGLSLSSDWVIGDLPLDIINSSLPPYVFIGVFLVTILPTIVLGLIGISLLIKKNVLKPLLLGVIFGLWILSIGALSIVSISLFNEFKSESSITNTQELEYNNQKILINSNDVGEKMYQNMNFDIQKYDGETIKIETIVTSYGKSKEDAAKNAEMINYSYSLTDSTLSFNNNFDFKDSSKFRFQKLLVKVYIPQNVEYSISENFNHYLGNSASKGFILNSSVKTKNKKGNSIKNVNITSFNNLKISGAFDCVIKQANFDSISIIADEKYLDFVEVYQKDNILDIRYDDNSIFSEKSKNVEIQIWTKEIHKIELLGSIDAVLNNIQTNDIELVLAGVSDCEGTIKATNLTFALAGSSSLELIGNTENMKGVIAGASNFEGVEFTTQNVDLNLLGASDAEISVEKFLKADLAGACSLKYKGNPEKEIETSGACDVDELN